MDAPFTGERYVVKEGNVLLDMAPYQVCVLQTKKVADGLDPGVREVSTASPLQQLLALAPDHEAGPSW
jgi:hypothetical protein